MVERAPDCPRDAHGFCLIALITWNGMCLDDRKGNCKTHAAITAGTLDPQEALERAATNYVKSLRRQQRAATPPSTAPQEER